MEKSRDIGRALKKSLVYKDRTMEELAEEIGVSRPTLYRYMESYDRDGTVRDAKAQEIFDQVWKDYLTILNEEERQNSPRHAIEERIAALRAHIDEVKSGTGKPKCFEDLVMTLPEENEITCLQVKLNRLTTYDEVREKFDNIEVPDGFPVRGALFGSHFMFGCSSTENPQPSDFGFEHVREEPESRTPVCWYMLVGSGERCRLYLRVDSDNSTDPVRYPGTLRARPMKVGDVFVNLSILTERGFADVEQYKCTVIDREYWDVHDDMDRDHHEYEIEIGNALPTTGYTHYVDLPGYFRRYRYFAEVSTALTHEYRDMDDLKKRRPEVAKDLLAAFSEKDPAWSKEIELPEPVISEKLPLKF